MSLLFFRNICIKLFAAFFILSFFVITEVCAQQDIVVAVRVKDNKSISEATILSKIKTKSGDVFNQDILNDDIKRLYAMGYFTDVSMDVEKYKQGFMITIIVEEKPIVEDIVFEGNKTISARRLKKDMQTKPGQMLNYSKLSQDMADLKTLYTKYGYYKVDMKYEIQMNENINSATVKIIINEKEKIKIRGVEIEGNNNVSSKVLLNMMQTKPAWWFIRQGFFDEQMLTSDMEKLKRYYQSLGYLDVSIVPEFSYDDDGKALYITLIIGEGERYSTGSITVQGNLVFPKEEIETRIQMVSGEPMNYGELRVDMDRIKEFYYQKGYMNVEIDVDRNLNPTTNQVDLAYNINAHEIVYVGTIDIKGNTKTKDIVLRRELRIYPGERFDGDSIRRSKERLYNLGYFEDIYFDTEQSDDPNVRNLVINVKETKTGEFAFGGGYSSIDEFIGFVQITQRNFDILNFPYFTGDGQYFVLRANVGNIKRDFELSWTEPWIFDYPLSFGFDGYNRTHTRSTEVGYGYKEVRSGGDLRFAKEFGERFKTDLTYKLEQVNITDLSADATEDLVKERGANWISAASLGLTYDARDNMYVPKKGYLAQLIVENAGGFLGFDKNFYKFYLSTSYYYTFFDKLVMEVKGRAGVANSYGSSDDVPIYERFYSGGANTIRGYRERRVGPRDPGSNDPIGGNATAIGNIEFTYPIYERMIKGAIFYDVGNVWSEMGDFFQGGFKQGIGLGVRVKTPIGPLKLDAGYPLSENHDDDKKIEWYFSVSHGF